MDNRLIYRDYARTSAFMSGAIPTHCDYCANACGFCRWSKKGVQKPIPGWDAIRRDIPFTVDRSTSYSESYVVLARPEFVLEPQWESQYRTVDWERVRRRVMCKQNNFKGST